MIYLDTSVALAELLAEDIRPDPGLWNEPLFSSRLLAYETWTRIHARGLEPSHGDAARMLLARVSLVALQPAVLERALEPFPVPVRTLDALHLATVVFLRGQRLPVALATCDARMRQAATQMQIPLAV